MSMSNISNIPPDSSEEIVISSHSYSESECASESESISDSKSDPEWVEGKHMYMYTHTQIWL